MTTSANPPTVSIGMPVYNGEPFIRDALDSLLNQTFTDFELIISDNASTDDTEAICHEYAAKDKRVRYVRHPKNNGGLANFLFVLDKAAGEYFMWAAHDDVWDPNWVAELYMIVAAEPDVFAYGRVVPIDFQGNPLSHPARGQMFHFNHPWAKWRRLKFFLSYDGYGKANCINGLYPRSALRAVKFDIKGIGTDLMFIYDELKSLKMRASESTYQYKRIHDACMSASPVRVTEKNKRWTIRLGYLFRDIFLLEVKLIGKYLQHSNSVEKIFLFVLAPVRIIGAFWGTIVMSRHAHADRYP